jgi:branched-chain amino acid transport system permease protein
MLRVHTSGGETDRVRQGAKSLSQVIQTLVNGLALGGVYALTTLGLVIVFGIMRLINFAYAELIMAGGYALWIFTSFGIPWLAALGMAIVVTTLLAVLMERLAFRPLRDASAATLLIASFAVSSFLQRFVEVYIWPRPIAVPIPAIFSQTYELGGVRIPKVDILSILVTGAVLISLTLMLKRTLIGIALRAAAEDFATTRLMGIDANRIIATAFAIEGVLAGIVMLFWVGSSGVVYPALGLTPIIIAFMAAVVGGMRSLTGAVVGGFVVGFLFTALATFLPAEFQNYRQALLFVIVVAVLLVRPGGIVSGNVLEETR